MKNFSAISFFVFAIAMSMSFKNVSYGIGDEVKDFGLKNIDNKIVRLSDYKTVKGVIVIFDCNTCPYSQAYNKRIIALHEKYASKGYPVIAINSNDPDQSPGDSFEDMVYQAKTGKYTFPYLVDEKQNVALEFGATNTPHVFLLQKNGETFNVAYKGTIDDQPHDASKVSKRYLENAVDELLAAKPITVTTTKAIGCGIKWK